MTAHRYWRIYVTTSWNGSYPNIGSVSMRNAAGGAILAVTGNGTASASSTTGGHPASNAFVGDETSPILGDWYAAANPPGWLQWDFGSGNEQEINHLTLWMHNTSTASAIKAFELQYSDDGSAWTTLISDTTGGNAANSYYAFEYIEPFHATAAISLPLLQNEWVSGNTVALTLPSLTGAVAGGAMSSIALPAIQAFVSGHDSTGERAAAITLPSLTASAYSGANATLTLPSLSASTGGTVTILAQAPITLPAFTSSATGTVTSMAHAGISLPSLNSVAYSGAVISITLGSLTTASTGVTGSVGQAHITLPLFEATATTTVGIVASAAITLPSLTMQTGSHVAVSLPPLSMVAIGTAVVTATYEAYAVNLGHVAVDAAQGAIDEVTRYTNFPFTHVVRYQNHYYGANSTGLYLLEGTTDAGTAIPWAVKTGIDDFKTPQKKTVAAAYFAGRFGPASTIQLYAGEQAPNTYSFSTPRDALAQNHRQVFGKGVKERFYALGASGTGTVELDGIELEVHTLSRRI